MGCFLSPVGKMLDFPEDILQAPLSKLRVRS